MRSARPRSSTGVDVPGAPTAKVERPRTPRQRAISSDQRDRRRPDVPDSHGHSENENPGIAAPKAEGTRPRSNQDWWPNQPDLRALQQHSPSASPLGEDFDYA